MFRRQRMVVRMGLRMPGEKAAHGLGLKEISRGLGAGRPRAGESMCPDVEAGKSSVSGNGNLLWLEHEGCT